MRFLRFWYKGPGVILLIVGGIITVAYIVHKDREKKESEDTHETQRPMGSVNPKDTVDQTHAQKKVELANEKLNPVMGSQQPTPTPQNMQVSNPIQRQSLPTLVSFYAQVAATPTPTPSPTPERKPVPQIWLPPSTLIPCVLINCVESSHINTPVMGEVLQDVIQDNDGVPHVIIPRGTIASAMAQSGAVRNAIEVAGTWLLVYPDGRQLKITGMALNRDAHPDNKMFGPEDAGAGLRGEIKESDHWASFKALMALLITTSGQAVTAAAGSALQANHGASFTSLPDTTPILQTYLAQLLNGETGDGKYVQVLAGTEFYIFPCDTILPTHRTVVSTSHVDTGDQQAAPLPSDPTQAISQMERELSRSIQPQASPSPGNPSPNIKF